MKVILYARVSTADQANDGVSLHAQQEKMNAYASLYELEVVETIVDAGESGKTLDRPGLQRALNMLRKGQAEGLVICKLDRLTRAIADWQTMIDDYFGEKAGKQLFSVADSIDTRTAAGRLVLNVLLSVAQWERETIGERTKEALEHKIRNGERCGKVRYGFDLGDDGRSLVPNADEQATIQLMVELREQGRTYREIAETLSAMGVRTKEGLTTWKPGSIHGILKRAA
jgi:DNA invertase Pin-like site-specific DNA recombinase